MTRAFRSALAPAMFFALRTLVVLCASWVYYVWATSAFSWFDDRRRQRRLALALIGLMLLDPVSDLVVAAWHVRAATLLHSAFVILFTTLILAAVPVALLHGLLWAVARRTSKRAHAAPTSAALVAAGGMTRRRVVEGAAGAALFGATGSMLGWGMVRGRHAFEMCEFPVRVPGLPRSLDGYVIAQISDIHAGAFVGEQELREGLALVREARPDLIVVTGDLVDFDPRFAPLTARKLADLPARDGVVAALGNHDYYAGADGIVSTLTAAGIVVLRDEGKRIRPRDGGGFALLGVDDLASVRHGRWGPRLDRALSTVPSDLARILLSHQPSTVDQWAGRVAVQLSGHTHGGQINPGFSPVGLMLKYVAGPYTLNGTTLYVNRGFGTVGAPSRVGAPPEVTRIVLMSA